MPDANEFHPSPLSTYCIQGQSRWRIPRGATRGWEHSVTTALTMGCALGCAHGREEAPGRSGGALGEASYKTEHLIWCLEGWVKHGEGKMGS